MHFPPTVRPKIYPILRSEFSIIYYNNDERYNIFAVFMKQIQYFIHQETGGKNVWDNRLFYCQGRNGK